MWCWLKQLCGIIFCFLLLRQTKQHQWRSNTFHLCQQLFWNFILQFLCFEQEGSLRPAMCCWSFLLWEGKCLYICVLNITCLICFIFVYSFVFLFCARMGNCGYVRCTEFVMCWYWGYEVVYMFVTLRKRI